MNIAYSLMIGPFQSSNFFDNVPAGIHEVYVNDKMDVVLSANVLRYLERQNFHSNGDGYNDYWNVKGVNASFNTNSIIFTTVTEN
jgi:hypothetical protein